MGSNEKLKEIEAFSGDKKLSGLTKFFCALTLVLSAGLLTGIFIAYQMNNSNIVVEVSALATYRPPEVTVVYADDGETVLAEFALEKRIPIKEKDIPPVVEDALLAIEDIRFYDHIGIDPYRIVGAAIKNITTGRVEGASTITQQLAKNLFLSREQTISRKVTEWLMALQIERFYTKRQILEMYINYVFLGAGSYGFEAGARTYFGKPLKDVTLEEAALLAAIPKSPEYSPTRNMKKALERRNIVLDQMGKYFPEKYPAEAIEAAKAKPIKLADTAYYRDMPKSTAWDYPMEEIRKYLEEKYTTRVAQGGLKVYSTINVEAQKLATKAIREGLRRYDRSRPWRSDYQNILVDENNNPITDAREVQRRLEAYKHPDWYGNDYEEGEFIKGLVMSVDAQRDEALIRFGKYTAVVTEKDMGRSRRKPKDELKPGYLAEFEIKAVDKENQKLKVELSQVPEVQAALICLNAKTGEIVAMVGGYDFATNKFNNATQGMRQTGSAFKPFVYAAALEWGMTPDMLVSGAPIKRGGWQPRNYDGSLSHPNVPMRVALAKSYNIAAVHLMDQVGIQTVAQMVRRFGITNPMAPYLPSALGATEVPLIEMVSAYSAFPNRGVRVEPHLIRKVLDRDGKVLEEWQQTTSRVTSEYVALTMVDMMQDVVRPGGTASNASAGGHPLAGKTGTVNNHTDVWFIGFTPTYVTGVWMGNPQRKTSLGKGMTGGVAAVPFFNAFMIPFMKDKEKESFPKPPPMPVEIRAIVELRKREALERLEKAQEEAAKLGLDEKMTKTGEVLQEQIDAQDSTPTQNTEEQKKQQTEEKTKPELLKPIDKPLVTEPPPVKKNEPERQEKKDKRGNDNY
ncbi:MAG: PBP1A family penicillin-binding protein [Pyrinomonadaceae bacterium]|nr:PBP1A family penicillin-binding protein [Pyrinomonadaceae bacterium]